MAELRLKNVTKRFGSYVGVDNFNLDIADQEFIVLLGPSGCGKTTTLRLIAGFLTPDDGEIRVAGTTVSSGSGCVPPERRGMGMVFQNYAIWPHKTVFENVAFGLQVRKVPAPDRRSAPAGMEWFGIRARTCVHADAEPSRGVPWSAWAVITDAATRYQVATGADDVVIELTNEGGFVMAGTAFANAPVAMVTGDDLAISTGPVTLVFPGPLLPNILQRTITPGAVQELLAHADELGLLADVTYAADPLIADASTTVLTLTVDGTTYRHEAYALGIDEVAGSRRSRRQISVPGMSGNMRSSRIRSGRWRRISASAPFPSRAVTIA